MTGPKKHLDIVLRWLEPFKHKFTSSPRLPLLSGIVVLLLLIFTIFQYNQEKYSDELGFTGDSAPVTREETPQQKIPAVQKEQIKPGESLYTILIAKKVTPHDIDGITQQLKGQFSLRGFRPGQSYETKINSDGSLQRFSYFQDRATTIHIEREKSSGTLKVRKETIEYDTRVATLEGTVTTSISHELQTRKRSSLLSTLRPVFASRLDFRHDIKPGTKYRILFEEKWLKDEFVSTGKILAVEFKIGNRNCNAYHYTDVKGKSGFFDEKGNAFERTASFVSPCNYSHISSGFGYRIHPIFRTLHFHGGVDMVAATGTPVHAVADGKIIFLGRKGGAGNMVTLSHSNGYFSEYLHLSRYSPRSGYGNMIRQGEIIGYVGSTGSSTGPHLDFRMILNGKPMNPLAVLASSTSGNIAQKEMRTFLSRISEMHTQLDNNQVLIAGGSSQRKGEAVL